MKKLDFLFQTYLQFSNLLVFANKQLDHLNSVYGEDKRFVKFNTYPYAITTKKLEETETPEVNDDSDYY